MKLIAVALALIASQVAALKTESHDAFVPAMGSLYCDGNSYKCKTQLKFGANNYWAVWGVSVTSNPPQ